MSDTTPRILIAEDNPGLARVLSFKFKSSGFDPITCANGKVAWEAFQTESVAAVISDQEMPYMTGLELCEKIRQVDQGIPFFLVTGRQLELVASGAANGLNITNIFAKPFSPGTVQTAVSAAIIASTGGASV
tara:strand:- start:459689 stop:460084 length:396 start_codon:yes stop_codon:yes gene_type:complete